MLLLYKDCSLEIQYCFQLSRNIVKATVVCFYSVIIYKFRQNNDDNSCTNGRHISVSKTSSTEAIHQSQKVFLNT